MAPIFKRGGQITVGDKIDLNGTTWEVMQAFEGVGFRVNIDGIEAPVVYKFDNSVYYKIIS